MITITVKIDRDERGMVATRMEGIGVGDPGQMRIAQAVTAAIQKTLNDLPGLMESHAVVPETVTVVGGRN